jgi:hypothetical protein
LNRLGEVLGFSVFALTEVGYSWVTDFNIRSQLKGEGYAFLSSGLSLRFDCNRKFNRQDKLKIKAEKFS